MIKTMEHPKLVMNPIVIYIVAGLLASLLQFLVPLPFLPRPAAWIIGTVLILLNLLVGLPALREMIREKTSPNPSRPVNALVSSGIFRITRNPMYLGMALLYAGLMAILHNAWGWLLLPVVIWLITAWVIRPEEDYLEQRFGQEYLAYKLAVRRWI